MCVCVICVPTCIYEVRHGFNSTCVELRWHPLAVGLHLSLQQVSSLLHKPRISGPETAREILSLLSISLKRLRLQNLNYIIQFLHGFLGSNLR